MTPTTTPPPGSPWASRFPDAFPVEWFDALHLTALPTGFTRFATDVEADVITGRAVADEPRPARRAEAPSVAAKPKRKPSAVVVKLFAANRFADGLAKLEPRLTPLAVAVWLWLWRCERKGLARCSVNRLADRFGVGRSTVQRRLHELRERGFIRLVRRGKSQRSASVYRVSSFPKPIHN